MIVVTLLPHIAFLYVGIKKTEQHLFRAGIEGTGRAAEAKQTEERGNLDSRGEGPLKSLRRMSKDCSDSSVPIPQLATSNGNTQAKMAELKQVRYRQSQEEWTDRH